MKTKSNKVQDKAAPPLVSVIMNCLNCEKYLQEAIDSVYAQTYPNWEIIFWDNASTDKSAEKAKSYDERLKYFCGEETIPLGAARNKAIEQAQGEFIAFLDCDDLWMPEKLEKQIPLFDDPEVGLVFSNSIFFNNDSLKQKIHYKNKSKVCRGNCFRSLLKKYFLTLGTVVIKANILNYMDEWFDPRFQIIEEMDFFCRIAYDWKIDCTLDCLMMWRIHKQSWSYKHKELSANEKEIMIQKFYNIFVQFKENYAHEIDIMDKQIHIKRCFVYWKIKDNSKARHELKYIYKKNSKVYILYLCTYLPYKMIYPLHTKFKKLLV